LIEFVDVCIAIPPQRATSSEMAYFDPWRETGRNELALIGLRGAVRRLAPLCTALRSDPLKRVHAMQLSRPTSAPASVNIYNDPSSHSCGWDGVGVSFSALKGAEAQPLPDPPSIAEKVKTGWNVCTRSPAFAQLIPRGA